MTRQPNAPFFNRQLLLWTMLPWLALLFLKSLENWASVRLRGGTIALGPLLLTELPIVAAGMLATPFALWLGFRLPLTRHTWRRNMTVILPAALLIVLAINAVRTLLWVALGAVPGGITAAADTFVSTITSVFHIDVINVCFMLAIGQLLWILRDRQERALRASRLEAQLTEARLHVLQARIQPHFLFNSLHTIGQLVRSARNDEAMDVVERLGLLLRSALEERPALIPLAEEIEFAHAYLDIEAVRFSDRLRVSWNVEPGLEAGLVPALLLQPLIENAVRHAVAPRRKGGAIHVSIARDDVGVLIDVSDDGPGFGASCAEPGTGTGLNNTRDRLHAAWGAAGTIELGRSAAGGARVTVRLPFVDSGAAVPVGATS